MGKTLLLLVCVSLVLPTFAQADESAWGTVKGLFNKYTGGEKTETTFKPIQTGAGDPNFQAQKNYIEYLKFLVKQESAHPIGYASRFQFSFPDLISSAMAGGDCIVAGYIGKLNAQNKCVYDSSNPAQASLQATFTSTKNITCNPDVFGSDKSGQPFTIAQSSTANNQWTDACATAMLNNAGIQKNLSQLDLSPNSDDSKKLAAVNLNALKADSVVNNYCAGNNASVECSKIHELTTASGTAAMQVASSNNTSLPSSAQAAATNSCDCSEGAPGCTSDLVGSACSDKYGSPIAASTTSTTSTSGVNVATASASASPPSGAGLSNGGGNLPGDKTGVAGGTGDTTSALSSAQDRVDAANKVANAAASGCQDGDSKCQAIWDEQANAQAALKTAQVNDKQQGRANRIMDKDDAKTGVCGRYGAADCSTTVAINGLAPVVDKSVSAVGGQIVSSAGAQSTFSMNSNTTQSDMAIQQAKILDKAATSEATAQWVDTASAIAQAERLAAHMTSASKVGSTQKLATTQINNLTPLNVSANPASQDAYTTQLSMENTRCGPALTTPGCTLVDRQNNAVENTKKILRANVTTNAAAENQQQSAMIAQTMAATMATGAAMQGHIQQKLADKAQAQAYMAYANSAQGSFAFNPNAPVANVDGSVNNAAPVDNSVIAGTAADTGLPGDQPLVNPNLGDGGIQAPTANPFVSGAAPAAGQGSGAYAGTAGGTSAAKDDGKAAEAAAAKAQTGGTYGNDSATPKFSRSGDGGGGGVGLDGAFADLLKKFQPDDNKKDTAGSMVFGDDRSPASERNAVLRQDQDIFGAISKRMKIKAQQGAISLGNNS